MDTKLTSIFIISLALLAGAPHADSDASMTAFCTTYLNISQNVSENITLNETNQTQNETNFTFSGEYYAAEKELAEANASVERLRAAGLPSLRAQDTYSLALQWFGGQAAIEVGGDVPDYAFISEKFDEISSIEKDSFATNDELFALSARLNTTEQGVNLTKAKALQSQARAEFADGRFAEAGSLITRAHDEISTAESDFTRSNTLVESTRKNMEAFLQENWQNMAIISAAIFIVLAVFQRQIRRFIIDARLKALASEKAVLEGMIKNVQRDYFGNGRMSELSYRIKTKKFNELIRNINRQVPLLKEELKRI